MIESTQCRPAVATAEAIDRATEAAKELLSRTGADSYDTVVVLGSGWSGGAGELGTPDSETDVEGLPHFVAPSAQGHSSVISSVWAGSQRVVVFHGRPHLYEVGDPHQVVHAVRTGIAAGARRVILTGGAGSLRTDFAVGQPILVRDHINLTGASPLVGPDFVDLTNAYSQRLRQIARGVDPALAEGVYGTVPGPQYRTPAELRMLRMGGADLVGMSVALETIAAVQMGAEVLAMALVTNDALEPGIPVSGERSLAVSRSRARGLGALLNRMLLRM